MTEVKGYLSKGKKKKKGEKVKKEYKDREGSFMGYKTTVIYKK